MFCRFSGPPRCHLDLCFTDSVDHQTFTQVYVLQIQWTTKPSLRFIFCRFSGPPNCHLNLCFADSVDHRTITWIDVLQIQGTTKPSLRFSYYRSRPLPYSDLFLTDPADHQALSVATGVSCKKSESGQKRGNSAQPSKATNGTF